MLFMLYALSRLGVDPFKVMNERIKKAFVFYCALTIAAKMHQLPPEK